jgi:hypothetical protein
LPSNLEANIASLTDLPRLLKGRGDTMLVEGLKARLKQFGFCLL